MCFLLCWSNSTTKGATTVAGSIDPTEQMSSPLVFSEVGGGQEFVSLSFMLLITPLA